MTIKKRLMISNFLMIIIPILLSIIIGIFTMFIIRYFIFLGIGDNMRNTDPFYDAQANIREIASDAKGQTLSEISIRLDELKKQTRFQNLSFYIFDDETVLYQSDANISERALQVAKQDILGEQTYQFKRYTLYVLVDDSYKWVLYDSTIYEVYEINQKTLESLQDMIRKLFLAALVFLILIVFITNRLLTKYVINSILSPLNQLIDGVRQIRDGNLNYRIRYQGKDEFKQVCDDFNKMAYYLQSSVAQQQRDYDSRKELLAGISHDLRTPLTSIKGYIIGLEQGIDTSLEIRNRYITVLKRKTGELETLINQLFSFSKIDIGEFPMQIRPLNLAEELTLLIEDISCDYESQGLAIHFQNFTDQVIVDADLLQLKTVIVNVCENTLKYVDVSPKVLQIKGFIQHDFAILRMTDNGHGVPINSLPSLFDVFYRADKSRNDTSKGSGLGLAISKKIMERMNGWISAQIGDTGGLCIKIYLPVVVMAVKNQNGVCCDETNTGD